MPQRIQRKRTKGWRMPEGAIHVARPSVFGNPAVIERVAPHKRDQFTVFAGDVGPVIGSFLDRKAAHETAVRWFRWWLLHTDGAIWRGDGRNMSFAYVDNHQRLTRRLEELRGHDLACWCPPELACHADVLLELANGGERP